MFDSDYFISLSNELSSLKNRVRNFIQGEHWLTDGEWKESVLRSFLRRNLPKSVEIGREVGDYSKDSYHQAAGNRIETLSRDGVGRFGEVSRSAGGISGMRESTGNAELVI